ncbi:lysylphosphatidylglycerol synthase domain-containing protein [Marivirga salinae]|uniref:Lysylphosphatidylglycerol synthase domain-containing protein n=1 Tax=Marivirga salinarum TaxID=3059078 RepID=A0AA51RDV5_9BACT|nr:lysylphosphatidylglycerol synthase domain-containing protein [Marivirga sp. BDSF4-3]WMN11174.1 lysylphosphatidylglycerol synthase domain-containing protein [Marivirga sp. BDSF4-3]
MKRALLIIIKLFVTILVVLFLYEKISEDKAGFASAFQLFNDNFIILFLVVLLMPFNWFMEVLKWKYSIQPITHISLSKASTGVLAGIALGFVTPHAVGDYFAKVFSLTHHNRKKALGLILVSRMMQMLPTSIFGVISFYIYSNNKITFFDIPFSFSYPILSLMGLLLLILLLILFLKRNHPKIQDYVQPVRKMGIKLINILAGLSMLRYLIFSAQFLLLLSILNLKVSIFMQFMGVSFMFLAKSILPTFNFLSDLGIREFSVALFFESMKVDVAPIIASGLILWLINIALPALIGLFFIPKLKLKSI